MQGVQHVVESRGIGVYVHLPSVALKAFVGGSHGHCWVELRYLLRHLQYTVSTCRWVKARSDWFESSWSKRHMLTRSDLRDSDKHCRHVRRPLTMPTQEYLVSTRFVLTFLLYLACHGRGARQPKAAAMLAELFVASIGQVTTVAMLVLGLASVVDNWFAGSGKQVAVQAEDVVALMPRLPSKKRFQRVDSGTKLICSTGAIRQKRAKTISSFVQAHRGGSAFSCISEFGCRNVMAQVVASSVSGSRRVFTGSHARRICISADEFNRESSRMILICLDLCSNVFGFLPLQVTPHRVEKRAMVFFVLFLFYHLTPFFDQNAKTTFLIKKSAFLIEKRGQIMTCVCHSLTLFFSII